MKNILIILIALSVLQSCGKKIKNEPRELVPDPEKYVHDGNLDKSDSLKPRFIPDTLIGQVSLINPSNVENYFGKNVMDRLNDDGLPNSSVLSSDSKQRLRFYFHPGNGSNDFSEFKISYIKSRSEEDVITTDREFITESGIKLGLTTGQIKSLKGDPDLIAEKETTVFHYKIDEYDESKFLEKYNMPSYYADYEFRNGYLIEFRFGFDYP